MVTDAGFGIVGGVIVATLVVLYELYKAYKANERRRAHREYIASPVGTTRRTFRDEPTRATSRYVDPVVHYEATRGLKGDNVHRQAINYSSDRVNWK